MAYTYTTTPFDDIARVRLIIGDHPVPITGAHFTDEEIIEFLTTNGGNITLAAADALGAWAAAYATSPDSEKIGDYAYTQKIIANMNKLKKELEEKDATTPYLTWAEMDLAAIGETPVEEV